MSYTLNNKTCGTPTPPPANTGGCCGGGCGTTNAQPAPPPVSTTIPTDTGVTHEPGAVAGTTGPTYEPESD